MNKHVLISVCTIAFACASVSTAPADTIHVPADQPTIQAGIDAAADGDVVLIADGVYTGPDNKNLDFAGKAITVRSENGRDKCIIDCEEDGRGFYFHSAEGADSILTPEHLQRSYDQGLRAIGLSHYGPGRYAGGTNSDTHLAPEGKRLLAEMERLGMIVDATHLNDESFWEVLDHFGGAVWASHQNCRELVPGVRQFSDEQLRALIDRGAVMGMALDDWMLVPDWSRGKSTPEGSNVTLSNAVDHIDHICQLAGNARHCGIGTDPDGGFGREQCPTDLETIADLQKIPAMLNERGYSDVDIAGIMHGNWL